MGSGCGELWAVGSDAGAAFDLWRLSAAPPGGGRTAGLVSLEALEAVQRKADFAQRAGAFFLIVTYWNPPAMHCKSLNLYKMKTF
jgi:hypothetical protein